MVKLQLRILFYISLVLIQINRVFIHAQITNKFEFIYTAKKEPGFKQAFFEFFIRSYNLNKDIKITGLDNPLLGDNTYKCTLNSDSIHLWDITGFQLIDSNTISLTSTYYVKNYQLTPAQQNRNGITYTNSQGITSYNKVFEDSSGKKYIKDWVQSGKLIITEPQLSKLVITNSNFWVSSQLKKNNMLMRNNYRMAAIGIPIVSAGVYCIVKIVQSYK